MAARAAFIEERPAIYYFLLSPRVLIRRFDFVKNTYITLLSIKLPAIAPPPFVDDISMHVDRLRLYRLGRRYGATAECR